MNHIRVVVSAVVMAISLHMLTAWLINYVILGFPHAAAAESGRGGSRSHLAPVDAVAYRCVPLEKTVPHPRALVRAPLLPSRLNATLSFLKGARQGERHLWCQMRMMRVFGIITAATAELDLAN